MSAYHSVRVEGREGERVREGDREREGEHTKRGNRGTEGKKGEGRERRGKEGGGRIFHMRWSNRRKEPRKKDDCASYLLQQSALTGEKREKKSFLFS